MMHKTRLQALLLVNWRGIFFQPFELNSSVTALEGENGAGKTTVMIGTFVALLPDPRLLQFRNLSEAGASEGDRGIYGRLGEKGFSYSVLDIMGSTGQRILAGVLIKKLSEPKLELTPFTVEGLTSDTSLENLFLTTEDDREQITDFPEVQQRIGRLGAIFTRHDTVVPYCKKLFELNVLPLSMELKTEREKFYRMLHTSMYGGLSGSIQKGLRDYLLTEDRNLRSHVSMMRENLDTCRTTRRELSNVQQRYNLIQAVYKAGFGMFEAAFHATRLRFENQRGSAKQTRFEHRERKRILQETETQIRKLEEQHQYWQTACTERGKTYEQAKQTHETCKRASDLAQSIKRVGSQLMEAESLHAQALAARDLADAAYKAAEAEKEKIEREREEINKGLGDAQEAYKQVHDKVSKYHRAVESLEDARQALPGREVTQYTAQTLSEECDGQWQQALGKQTIAQQALDSFDNRYNKFQDLVALLSRLYGQSILPEATKQVAAALDREYRDIADRVERAKDLPQRIEQATAQAKRQIGVREKISEINAQGFSIQSADDFRQALNSVNEQAEILQQQLGEQKDTQRDVQGFVTQAEQAIAALKDARIRWNEADDLRQALQIQTGCTIENADALTACKKDIENTLRATQKQYETLEQQEQDCAARIRELEYGGGHLDERLLNLRDLVDGELLLERYEDVPENEAAQIEARLGPLHAALVVEDIQQAARHLATEADRPDTLWLMQGHRDIPDSEAFEDAELVNMGQAWRLSRRPEKPVIGRVAREKALNALRQQADQLQQAMQTHKQEQERYQQTLDLCEQLSPYRDELAKNNPEIALSEKEKACKRLQHQLGDIEKQLQATTDALGTSKKYLGLLNQCATDVALLDEQDWQQTLQNLQAEQTFIKEQRIRLENSQADLDTLRANLSFLEQTPPSEQEKTELQAQLKQAQEILQYWRTGRELLKTLCERLDWFQYHDQKKLLQGQESALAKLKETLEAIKPRLAECRSRLENAETEKGKAYTEFNKADAKLQQLSEYLQSIRQQLSDAGESGSQERLNESQGILNEAERQHKKANEAERETNDKLIQTRAELNQRQEKLDDIRQKRTAETEELRRHWTTWKELKKETATLFGKLMGPETLARYVNENPIQLFETAAAFQSELHLHLEQAEQGESAWRNVESIFSSPDANTNKRRGYATLQAWLAVQRFLEQRIPRDVAQADEPEQALNQMASHLRSLQSRLEKQEQGLHQNASTVANGISSRLRREENRIRKLNKSLADVSFGSIRSVRIKVERIETMQELLDSLPTQKDLFNTELPLEQAMAELYKQVGGGQVRGDQLLDYREYIHMQVEVQRMDSTRWYKAHSNALSTGEAIGVGAAILMVILEALEHQSSLMRGPRSGSSLRFLFLDEANRLSRKSLDTLADFCERMHMQLLVAAPEAEQARHGITYCLIRDVGEQGEEVIVRGRRLISDKPALH